MKFCASKLCLALSLITALPHAYAQVGDISAEEIEKIIRAVQGQYQAQPGISPIIRNGNIRPMFSHYHLEMNGKTYSVWMLRPVLWQPGEGPQNGSPINALLRNPEIPYSSDLEHMFGRIRLPKEEEAKFWQEHEKQSRTLLGLARKAIGDVYRKQGYYSTPEKAAEQEAVFDQVFDGYSSHIIVSAKDDPTKIHQQFSFVPDKGDGLPIDKQLKKAGLPPTPRDRVALRRHNEFGGDKEGSPAVLHKPALGDAPDADRMSRIWVSGGYNTEMKAAMRAEDSPEDFWPAVVQNGVVHDVLKGSWLQIPQGYYPNMEVPKEKVAFYTWTDNPIFHCPGRCEFGFNMQRSFAWLMTPLWNVTTRTTQLVASAHEDKVKDHYVTAYGFDPEAVASYGKDGKQVQVLKVNLDHFEEYALEKARERKSGEAYKAATMKPATVGIDGKARFFVQLETLGEGTVRRALEMLAPDAKELIEKYRPTYEAYVKKARAFYTEVAERYGEPVPDFEGGINCNHIYQKNPGAQPARWNQTPYEHFGTQFQGIN